MTASFWKSYALTCAIAIIVASAAFVSYRNRTFTERELHRAERAAQELASGAALSDTPLAHGIVSSPVVSERYPFLKRRYVDGRALGGPAASELDKLLYDSASRVERSGAFVELADDGARAVAARPADGGVAVVVIVPPAGPEGFPLLVFLGILAMGALIAAAGTIVGEPVRTASLAIGGTGLAIPTLLWTGPVPATAIAIAALAIALFERRGTMARLFAGLSGNRTAYAFLGPTALAMLVLVAIPFFVGIGLGFYNHQHGEWTFVGLDNFAAILSGGGRPLSDPLNFWFTLGVTVAWTAVNVALHVTIGVALALVLRQSWLRGKSWFRILLILPWAVPNYITALIWRGMFQGEFGAINLVLESLGLDKVSWFSEWSTAFSANVCTNTWLGFPFMMVVALGALESIPRDMYEAAEVDGASAWQRFRHITVPHLMPALTPAIVLGSIWTFNMFNVIYLVSDGRPNNSTDILVTEAYRWAFERGERYGLAAAYAVIIFLILVVWTVLTSRFTGKERT